MPKVYDESYWPRVDTHAERLYVAIGASGAHGLPQVWTPPQIVKHNAIFPGRFD